MSGFAENVNSGFALQGLRASKRTYLPASSSFVIVKAQALKWKKECEHSVKGNDLFNSFMESSAAEWSAVLFW